MALDGITIRALTLELKRRLTGGRIAKITQPEADEIMLTIRTRDANERLLISAGASLPFVYLTEENRQAPLTAPNFCMLLRKHISGGHLIDISQPGLERIIEFEIEHLDEMGDTCRKILTVELMGKHSNIIFRKTDGSIIDSIKHVSAAISSVREVLPGREYFIPKAEGKIDLHNFVLCAHESVRDTIGSWEETGRITSETGHDEDAGRRSEGMSDYRLDRLLCKPIPLSKALYTTFTGFSPTLAESLCEEAGLDSTRPANTYGADELCKLISPLEDLDRIVEGGEFSPAIIYDDKDVPVEFTAVPLIQYKDMRHEYFSSVSHILISYYAKRDGIVRMKQKGADLRKIATTALERCLKKYDLQQKQLSDTDKMDRFKLWGELLQTYGYNAKEGDDKITCDNYYTNEPVTIPLDPTMSPMENSVRYFDRYSKLKRTKEAVTVQLLETEAEIGHLRSIISSLDMAENEEDLVQIKDELADSGYIRKRSAAKNKGHRKSSPLHFISSDGFHIYVGKNNYQNDEITFKVANAGDWWFHAKKIPGSHVIVRCEGKELTDRTFEEAASLAAYYSSGRSMGKVEIDYVRRKEIKKPSGAKPGFVVYYTNYSMTAPALIPAGLECISS